MTSRKFYEKIGELPSEAQARLKAAATVENTPEDPAARIKAINAASEWVKATFPNYFRKDC